MALLAFNKFTRDLEAAGALGVRIPLEGGHEGRYRRRVRTAGYECAYMSVRGLGDLSAYLLDIHGVRPPHLGKKNMDASATGDRYFVPPIVGYRLDGKIIKRLPSGAANQAAVEPIYETMPGWQGSTRGARSWADLPAEAVKYVRHIEELIGCPVSMVSTSPEREDVILMRDPFKA